VTGELVPVAEVIRPDGVITGDPAEPFPDGIDETVYRGPLAQLVVDLLADLRDARDQLSELPDGPGRDVGGWLRGRVGHHTVAAQRLNVRAMAATPVYDDWYDDD
jgi:hypothetical protein